MCVRACLCVCVCVCVCVCIRACVHLCSSWALLFFESISFMWFIWLYWIALIRFHNIKTALKFTAGLVKCRSLVERADRANVTTYPLRKCFTWIPFCLFLRSGILRQVLRGSDHWRGCGGHSEVWSDVGQPGWVLQRPDRHFHCPHPGCVRLLPEPDGQRQWGCCGTGHRQVSLATGLTFFFWQKLCCAGATPLVNPFVLCGCNSFG